MKRSPVLIIAAGLLLAAGLSGYLAFHRTGSAGVEKAGNVSTASGASAASDSLKQSAAVAPQHLAVAKNLSQPEAAVQVIAAPGDRFQPLDEAQILDRRVTTVSSDRKKRELLVKAGGKYPIHRIEETLVKNDGAETYSIVSRTEMAADHVLVKLQAGKNEDDLRAMLKSRGISTLRQLTLPGHYIISLKAPTLDAVPEALSVFSGESNVLAYAEPDFLSHALLIPNDTDWDDLWGMAKINAIGAWDRVDGSTNVVVAVIDSGIDLTHPDLVANLWENYAELNGMTGVDDDGNGFTNDVYGWDFANNDSTPADDYGHGTHCAGTVGAVGNNGLGVAGVCWTVRLMALKFLDADGRGYVSDSVEAVRYAADNGADIISASYGGPYSGTEYNAISYANGKGVLFVAAAGNDGANNDLVPSYPASYNLPNIVSVAATGTNDALASFSNYGQTSVDLAAPGVNIYSTVPGGSYDLMQGTSMATPHVAGAAALLLSAKPSLTHLELKAALLDSVDAIPSLADKVVSGGRLNVEKLITLGAGPLTGIVVRLPPGGAVLSREQINSIAWGSGTNVTGNVKIDLYRNGTNDHTIASNTADTGSYAWTIPNTQPSGTNYKIRVSSIDHAGIWGESQAAFSITTGLIYTNHNGTITITGYSNIISAVTIPGTIDGLPVAGIGDYAFYNCANLTGVTIPNSVTNIGSCAFFNCGKLSSVIIPDGVTGIGNQAFSYCTSLTSLMIGTNVTRIGYYVFSSCTNLTNVTIPGSVTNIGSGAFSSCTSLASVTIPNSVTRIESCAFLGCRSLVSITIPSSVVYVGDQAFSSCASLTGIYFEGNAPSAGYSVFLSDEVTVYRLTGATGWPTVPSVWAGRPTALWQKDLDSDGIPDWWEQQYFGNSTGAIPEAICSNGVNTVREAYIVGLDPNDPQSVFLTSILCLPPSGTILYWNAVSGRVYSVYGTTNLPSGFQCLESNIPWPQSSFSNVTADPFRCYKINVKLVP